MAENKNIEVGGRLHSIATGNVLVGANEIIDDDKNKKQSEINTETYSLVNDINERLSGLSPDQQSALSVATKATNNEAKLSYYVCDTSAATAAKVISATGYILSLGGSIKIKMTNANTADNATLNINSTGAKPLYYAGERASSTNSWEANEVVDIYYDGNSFYANNIVGGSSDGVFDVSAKYPTSGVDGGNTYTLEGALAVLNVNLSANKKKGGMSIKFIQSSDNKYVQYFLTKDSWSASEVDWEKTNLEEDVNLLNQEICPLYNRNIILEDGYYYRTKASNPERASVNYMQSIYLPVFAGEKITFFNVNRGDPSFREWQLYDLAGTRIAVADSSPYSGTLTISQNGFIAINNLKSNTNYSIYQNSRFDLVDGGDEALVPTVDYTQETGEINQHGEVNTTSSYWHSSPILMKKGWLLKLSTANKGALYIVYKTDSTGTHYTPLLRRKEFYPYQYEILFDEEQYISLNAGNNTSIAAIVTKDGVINRLNAIDALEAGNLNPKEERMLVDGVDYTKNSGNIRRDGTIETTSSYWYSTPIHLKEGDRIRVELTYVNGFSICETDSAGTYHRVLFLGQQGVLEYFYSAPKDMYITLSHQNRSIEVQLFAYLIQNGYESYNAVAKGYTDTQLTKLDLLPDNTLLNNAKDIGYENTDKKNRREALLQREIMLYEISQCSPSDILVSGTCGYDDSGSEVVHGTITWKIYKNGILHISGYGKMYDYVKGVMEGFNKSQLDAHQQANPDYWYYDMVYPGITYTDVETGVQLTFTERTYDSARGETPSTLPNVDYEGYAAPWYPYRTEIDFKEYTSKATYDRFNPTGIKYNRVCFEEDLTHGGITRIGDWALYRVCAENIVLPQKVESIGRWGVRYSPTVKTVIMYDEVTSIEEHGLSRMEAMETVNLSSALVSADYAAFVQNANLRHIEFGNAITSIAEYALANCQLLEKVSISGSVSIIDVMTLGQCYNLERLYLPSSVTSIKTTFINSKISDLTIPSSVTSITELGAFLNCYQLKKVTILSNSLSSSLTSNGTHLFDHIERLYIPESNTVSQWIYGQMKYIGIENGYKVFVN